MKNQPELRVSNVGAEGLYQASKWLKCPLLIDANEMEALFHALGPFYIFEINRILKADEGALNKEDFLKGYHSYVTALQQGQLPEESLFRSLFSCVFTNTPEALYAVNVSPGQHLVRISAPVVQLQYHTVDYSAADGKFHSLTYGTDSIIWGIQFSYPQLYKDNRTQEIKQVINNAEFSNSKLFQSIQQWVRHHTEPTPFLVEGKKINVPVRLGKNCFPWINRHPQLIKKGISVQQLRVAAQLEKSEDRSQKN